MSMCCLGLLLLLPSQDPPVRELVDGMRAESADLRHHAFNRLRRLGPAAEPELRLAAGDLDSEVAARSQTLLRSLDLRRSLSPRLLQNFPDLPERAAENPGVWLGALVAALELVPDDRHPDLLESDLEMLAHLALGQARTHGEYQTVFWCIGSRRLRGAFPALRAMLDHPVSSVRYQALQTLQNLRDRESVGAIARLLEDPLLQNQTSWVLGRFERASVIPAIRPYLEHPELPVRMAAMRVLRDVDSREAIPLLRARLSDPDLPIRAEAMRLLVRHEGSVRAIPDLQPFLDDRDPELQLAALSALQEQSSPEVWSFLRPLLRSENSGVRNHVIRYLRDSRCLDAKDDLVELLQDPSPQIRCTAAYLLARLGLREAIPDLLPLLTDPSEMVRDEGLRSLCTLDYRDILPRLVERLRDPEARIRGATLSWLDDRPWPEAAPAVALLLGDPDCKIRIEAIQLLQKMGDSSQAERLLSLLLKPHDPETEAAALLLKECRLPKLRPRLIDLASHEDAEVRALALDILACHAPAEAAPLFLKRLEDPDDCVRDAAIWGVARLKLREAIPALRTMLSDPARSHCLKAALALCDLEDWNSFGEMLAALTSDEDLAALLDRIEDLRDPEFIAPLEPLLDSGDRRVLRSVLDLFQLMKHPLATEAFRRVMRIDGHHLQMSCIHLLAELEDQESIPDLIRLLDGTSETVRNFATNALVRLGAREAIPVLMRRFLEDQPGERIGLLRALSRLGASGLGPQVLRNLRSDRFEIVEEAINAAEVLHLTDALPDLIRLTQDDDLTLRPLASAALLRLGDRGEIPKFLQRTCVESHLLNQFRSPELWERLRTTPQPRTYGGTYGQALADFAADAGLSLEVHLGDSFRKRTLTYRVPRRNGLSTLLEALESLYDPANFSFVLEQDRLILLPADEVPAFWSNWGRQQGFK
jgi:HEAT repeat protein